MTTIPHMPAQRPEDPRGWLTFDGLLPEPWQSAEDSTLENDFRIRARLRPATSTERALLEHLGYELPADLITHVQFLSATVRRRTWLDIKIPTPNTEG
ncbi:hypothetical protein QM787_04360 [Rhodococcus ruber]|uniref:hypothetical protein n=1 Tax=Rhodococcus TaxID=1827 RepID=UPI0019313282|nr:MULTISPECIES: hypothetical protein [Rhodococcus]MCD2127734.1 hypothetical protein [Rhodococcus ruber]MCZ1071681.1 hypothetical protein [Rhodococcus sp. A5(2022)]MCZ4504392.1 hypothetical protein [Rhodococcus ruber]MCZ4529372.1 hypothetical protein [Rhodococcus ruber]MCZ4621053.1 hypothetical protein [Rhodococcus ruber]